ncbi:MAG: FAD:protein FMN transferase [Candidatus Paceibacterota bacterium]|jgi:thiamine biosynthesis lipoprotein
MKEYEYTGKAMGTDFSISIVSDSKDLADKIAKESIIEIDKYEKEFSRFLSESELSKLNYRKEMLVSETFIKVIEEAYKLYVITNGIFNPLVQIERFGYDRDFPKINYNYKIEEKDYDIDFSSVIIDKKENRIILRVGQKLDFGGFLKGYLAEFICKKIKSQSENIKGVIVNIGGDIHTQGLDESSNKFIFNIYNPVTQKDDISIPLYNQSLATSGIYKRNWKINNTKIHHILDASGKRNPISDIISVSIIHENGGKSEAYTKVFLSIGPEEALKSLKDDSIKFVIIKKDGQIIDNCIECLCR